MTFEFPKTNLKWMQERTLFLTEHGSQAYGTALPTSDVDYKGVCIPPAEYFHGFANTFEQAEWKKTPDMVVYDIRKFFKLAADCNPSIIEVLFTSPGNHVMTSSLGERLLHNRDLFISKKAKFTFSGYAVSQMNKIETHFKWLKNPPKEKPTREAIGLAPIPEMSADQIQAAQSMIRKKIEAWRMPVDGMDDAAKIQFNEQLQTSLVEIAGSKDLQRQAGTALGFDDNFLDLLDKERLFKSKTEEWRHYQEWLEHRNPQRSVLEAKYGYDTKHGMHLVRLLRMGREILEGKGVIVRRPDAEELLSIRAGAWSYDQLIAWAKEQNKELERLYVESKAVPMAPDRKKLDTLCVELVEESLK